jgi:hypothetical protein
MKAPARKTAAKTIGKPGVRRVGLAWQHACFLNTAKHGLTRLALFRRIGLSGDPRLLGEAASSSLRIGAQNQTGEKTIRAARAAC